MSLVGPVAHASFTDVAESSGLWYVQLAFLPGDVCLASGFLCEFYSQTGGVAIGDYDNDGWLDVYATRYNTRDRLFRNNGDGTFIDVGNEAGLTDQLRSNAAVWWDCDLDGDLDLALNTVFGERVHLYVNDGQGSFTEDAVARGLAMRDGREHTAWGMAVGDFDRDGYPDLMQVEWQAAYSGGLNGTDHIRLLRNLGAERPGYFEDITESAGFVIGSIDELGANAHQGFAPAFVDLDQDHQTDIAVAGDFGTSTLLWNDGGLLTDGTVEAGVGTDENGMGSTFGDYDGDGDLDWFVTSIYDPDDVCAEQPCGWGTSGNRLYRNEGNRTFTDVTDAAGVRNGYWGWGAAFFDYDNDGYLDLTMTNGVDYATSIEYLDQFVADPMRFWVNEGDGTFSERSEELGVTDTRTGKGLAYFDYDRDGDLDFLVVNNQGFPAFYRNDTVSGNDWLQIRFEAEGKPYVPWNARVEVEVSAGAPPQVREVGVNTHFLGQSQTTLHFGLGAASTEPVHAVWVRYPWSGETVLLEDIPRSQELVIEVEHAPGMAFHDADFQAPHWTLSLSELLRIIQFFSVGAYSAAADSEDGFQPGPGDESGTWHDADYAPADGRITLSELLRTVQLYSAGGYALDLGSEDGFAPYGLAVAE